jgi:hypothetical protein
LLLITKLLSLRLHRVYYAFCCLLAADLLGSVLWWASVSSFFGHKWDYRPIWLVDRLAVWVFTIWTVALLLQSVLQNFPGILAMSRRVFRYAWLLAAAVGVASAFAEYSVSGIGTQYSSLALALSVGIICERVIATVALLAILLIFAFLLWFPVRIPRNLAYLCSGFVVYFGTITFFFLARSFWSQDTVRLASTIVSVIGAACYIYWAIFINAAGESVPARLTIEWRPTDQARLLEQLEGINQSLLRAARR